MALLPGVAVGFGLLLLFESFTRAGGSRRGFSGLPALPQIASAVVAAAAAYMLTGWPVLILGGAVIGGCLPRLINQQRSLAKRIELTDALADAAAGLRDAVKGGLGLSDGIAGLAMWGPPLLRDDITILATDAGRMGLGAAASRFAERLGDPGAHLLAATLAFNDRVGGRQVAEVLNAMADELAAEARTVRELRAGQARQRTSARVVALAPVALLMVLRQVNPGYLESYGTVTGQLVLGIATILIASGYLLMMRISRTIEPPRIAVGDTR
jgi:Flp pilus assembly protein TadB